MEIMRKAIEFSVNAGISLIQLAGYDVYYEEGDEDTVKWFVDGLKESADYAARWGVAMGFETMETPFMDTVEKSMAYVSKVNNPWLGVYPDIGNLKNAAVIYGTDVVEDMYKGAGHLFAVHLKETRTHRICPLHQGSPGNGRAHIYRRVLVPEGPGLRGSDRKILGIPPCQNRGGGR